ncbi:MAG: class I SAM-dependent methyltransferase [Caldilineae bacterium]|nr:MAG: class I SAM-dependent methyltransferase [Caldilineae bacterium]
MSEQPAGFQDALRPEYDPKVLDAARRTRLARRLHRALCEAGLWPPRGRLLDVGAGSGLLLAALGEDVALRVGCDLRRELFRRAHPHALPFPFAQADGSRLPFPDGYFNLLICRAAIEEFPDWRAALGDMARCVAPGGGLYVTLTNGKLLLPLYAFARRVGVSVPASWQAYARNSAPLAGEHPERGFDLPALRGWQFVDLTPHLIRATSPPLRLVPLPLLGWVARRLSPTFGFAWRRPSASPEEVG